MSHRVRDNSWKFFPKTSPSKRSQPSHFHDHGPPPLSIEDLEAFLGQQQKIFQEPIGGEEPPSPTKNIGGNR